jgi:hypothetical protein
VERDHFAPAMYNNPELTKRLVAAWKKTLGDPNAPFTVTGVVRNYKINCGTNPTNSEWNELQFSMLVGCPG